MTGKQILDAAILGAQLVNVVGVPIFTVIQMFRNAGASEVEAQEIEALILKWVSLGESIEARIATLKAQGAGG